MRLPVLCNFVLVFFLAGVPGASLGQCGPDPQSMSQEQLLSILRDGIDTPPQERDGACLTFVIRQLENQYSAEATGLLIKYLDFERPLQDAEKAGFIIHGPPTIDNRYPAASALVSFGKRAVPALLAAIANPSSNLVQRNAIYTFMQIFRDEPQTGIKVLREKSLEGSSTQSDRLRDAAQEAQQWCGRSHLDACKSAENGLRP